MAKWRVNKERINTDIPDRQGNVAGGAVTFPTKRLVVDAQKRIGSSTFEEQFYIKENIESNKEEERLLPDQIEEKNQVKECEPIANYRGIDMYYGLTQAVSEDGKSGWEQSTNGIDSNFNAGLNITGYTNIEEYQVPHINYAIKKFLMRGNAKDTFDVAKQYEPSTYWEYIRINIPNFYNNHVSYFCYALYTGPGTKDGKYYIGDTISQASISDPNISGKVAMVQLDLTNVYNVFTFQILDNNDCYKLGAWHFHTGESSGAALNYGLKKDENGRYVLDKNYNVGLPAIHALFFEYDNNLKYTEELTIENGKQLLWSGRYDRSDASTVYMRNNDCGAILVRRIVRDSDGRPIKKTDGSFQWELCVHAKSKVNYMMKTWNLSYSEKSDSFDKANDFFMDVICKDIIKYDDEILGLLIDGNDKNIYMKVDTKLYAEEISSTEGIIDSYDNVEYTLYEKDIVHQREYRTYDILHREEWKKTKKMVVNCVDDATCNLFKDYTQQLIPSTTIIKAERCKVDDNETIDIDEKIAELEPQNVNYSEWQTEDIGKEEDKFVRAEFKVYFDKVDGTNIETKVYSITDEAEYNKYLEKELEKPITEYPLVEGAQTEYWYMASNKSVVESGVALPPAYKFGEGFNMVDILKHSGVHFYPKFKPFTPVTYSVYFHDESDALLRTVSKTISSKTEYDQIVADGELPINLSDIPVVDGLAYWVKENDKDKDSHTDSEKYGTSTTQSIDLYQDNGTHFYPVRMVEIPMPMYINSANSMEVQGLCSKSQNDTNALGGGVVTSNNPYLTYVGDGLPLINWNPQRFYIWQKFSASIYSTRTIDDVKEEALTWCNDTVEGAAHHILIESEIADKTVYAYKSIGVSQLMSTGTMYLCFEFVGPNAKRTGLPSWHMDDSIQSSTYGDKTIDNNSLHGPDNGRFIAYVKFDSQGFSKYGGAFKWHWHWFQCGDDSESIAASQNDVYLPQSLTDITNQTNKIYSYSKTNEIYEYSFEKKGAETDVWYGLIIDPEIPNPKEVGIVTTKNPMIYLCEIHDEGVMKSEHEPYFNNSSTARKCYKRNKMYIFSITVKDDTVKWEIDEEVFGNYFSIKSDEATGEIIEIALTNKTDLLASEYGATCVYNPTEKLCIDIDAKYKNKKIFDSLEPICIPEFSGCTFVKAED